MTYKRLGGMYQLDAVIGSGAFATVYRGFDIRNNEIRAFKVIPCTNLSKLQLILIEREIKVMGTIESKFVVKLLDIVKTKNNIYLVMEFCPGGDMHSFLARSAVLSEQTARRLLQQVVFAFISLRKQFVVHRDLKLANVLLTSSDIDQADVKLADFGLTRILETDNFITQSKVGSPMYMAPEMLREIPSDCRVDVWSFGILASLMLGIQLFPGVMNIRDLEREQFNVQARIAASALSPAAKQLISAALQLEFTQRPKFEQLIHYDFFAEPSPSNPFPSQELPCEESKMKTDAESSEIALPELENRPSLSESPQEALINFSYRLDKRLDAISVAGDRFAMQKKGLIAIAIYQFYIREVEKHIEKAVKFRDKYPNSGFEDIVYKANHCLISAKRVLLSAQTLLTVEDLERSVIQYGNEFLIESRIFREAADSLISDFQLSQAQDSLKLAWFLLLLGKEDEERRKEEAERSGRNWKEPGQDWDEKLNRIMEQLDEDQRYRE